ncbi:MAG: AAA family ATPase [Planctomycetaceae bacterium]|nr:AAA family ATPase [Planctomycetaceae bacterium]
MSTSTRSTGNGRPVTSEILDRMPPADLEAERAVIGAVLIDPGQFDLVARLKPGDFHDERNAILYHQVADLHRSGAVDDTLLLGRLRESGDLERIGGMAYLIEIQQAVGLTSHAPSYAARVKEAALRRALIARMLDGLRAAYSGEATVEAVLSAHRAELDRIENGLERGERFPTVTAAELAIKQIDTPYLVDGILAAGQPCILAGPKKAGKTSVAIDLGVALSIGGHFLGRFPVPTATRTAIMSGESGLATIQDTIRRVADAAGQFPIDLDNLLICEELPTIGNADDMHALERFLIDNELLVLMIDPSYLAMPGDDTGNLHIVGARLRSLNDVCHRTGCTLILLHHTTKTLRGSEQFDPPELEHIAWAGYQEWARQWIIIGRRERYEPGTGLHRLWMTVGGSAGHSGRWGVDIDEGHFSGPGSRIWDVDVRPSGEIIRDKIDRKSERRREEHEAAKDAIVKALSTFPDGDGAFPAKLRAMTGIANERLQRLLYALQEDHIVEPCEALRSPTHRVPQAGAWRLTEEYLQDD